MDSLVNIYIFAHNRPDLLPVQVFSLRQNLLDSVNINVIHDSTGNEYVQEFRGICKKLGIQYHHHETEGSNPSDAHGNSLQWTYDHLITHLRNEDISVILDHDTFLIRSLNLNELMNDIHVVAHMQTRGNKKYFWPGILIFKHKSICHLPIHFHPGDDLDTGGGTHCITTDPSINVRYLNLTHPKKLFGVDLKEYYHNEELLLDLFDDTFLHTRNASFWGGHQSSGPQMQLKSNLVKAILDSPTIHESQVNVCNFIREMKYLLTQLEDSTSNIHESLNTNVILNLSLSLMKINLESGVIKEKQDVFRKMLMESRILRD